MQKDLAQAKNKETRKDRHWKPPQPNVENPVLRTGLLPKKKPFWPFIPALPGGAFWLFHVNENPQPSPITILLYPLSS
jgi:hypothetical protein